MVFRHGDLDLDFQYFFGGLGGCLKLPLEEEDKK